MMVGFSLHLVRSLLIKPSKADYFLPTLYISYLNTVYNFGALKGHRQQASVILADPLVPSKQSNNTQEPYQ